MESETSKIVIAIEFIETAAILWSHKINLYSAVHLAAAAEEISGKACRIEQKKAHYDEIRERVIRTFSTLGIELTDSQVKEAAYSAKNAIKHMDSRSDSTVAINPLKEAESYIVSAYRNFETLGLSSLLSSTVNEVVEASTLYVQTDA